MEISPQLFLELTKDRANLDDLRAKAAEELAARTNVVGITLNPYITVYANNKVEIDWSDTYQNTGIATDGEFEWDHTTTFERHKHPAADKIVQESERLWEWVDKNLAPAIQLMLMERKWAA